MNGEDGASHTDIIARVGRLEGALIELRSRGDARDASIAAVREDVAVTREDLATLAEVVKSVKETGEATAAKVDKLVSVFEQGKGAIWALATARWVVVSVVIAALGGLAWLATNWANVKKFLGMGA